MQQLEQRIMKDGKVLDGDILKVDSFINHQLDVEFLCEMGKEFHRLFADCGVDKLLTVEASGIGIACLTAQFFHVPVVFAKKSRSANISDDVYTAEVRSYTHGNTNTILVSKEFLKPGERVLLIDDFMAMGEAMLGLRELAEKAGCTVVGAGILIEKAFQPGGDKLRSSGLRVESLARIASMSVADGIRFVR